MIYHLQLLPKRIKIAKLEKLVAHLHNKTENVIDIGNLKQDLNHWVLPKKVHRVPKYWSTKKWKNDFDKDFLKLMNNSFFWRNYGECEKT